MKRRRLVWGLTLILLNLSVAREASAGPVSVLEVLKSALERAVENYRTGLQIMRESNSEQRQAIDDIGVQVSRILKSAMTRLKLATNATSFDRKLGIVGLTPEMFLQMADQETKTIDHESEILRDDIDRLNKVRDDKTDFITGQGPDFIDCVRRGHYPQSPSIKLYIVNQMVASLWHALKAAGASNDEIVSAFAKASSPATLRALLNELKTIKIGDKPLAYNEFQIVDGLSAFLARGREMLTNAPTELTTFFVGPNEDGTYPKEYPRNMRNDFRVAFVGDIIFGDPNEMKGNRCAGLEIFRELPAPRITKPTLSID